MQSANTVKFLFRKHITSYQAKLHTRTRHSRYKKAVQVSMRVGTFSKAILLHCKVTMQADKCNSLWLIFGRLRFRLSVRIPTILIFFVFLSVPRAKFRQCLKIRPSLLLLTSFPIQYSLINITFDKWPPQLSFSAGPGALYRYPKLHMSPNSVHCINLSFTCRRPRCTKRSLCTFFITKNLKSPRPGL